MHSLAINALHAAGVALGLWLLTRPIKSRVALWGMTAACCAVMGYFLLDVSAPPRPFEDFTTAYWAAGRAVLSGPGELRPYLEAGVNGFVNLPILAYLFSPFGLLPEGAAKWLFFLVGVGSLVLSWDLLRRRHGYDDRAAATGLFALVAFGPMIYSLREGNTSHILLAVILAGMAAASARKDLAAGALFALCALVKPPLLLLGVYAFARGRWRIVLGGAAVCLGAGLLSALVFGWDMHVLWIEQFGGYGSQPMPGFNAQSFASAAARLQLGYEHLNDWEPKQLILPLKIAVYGLTLLAFALGLRAALAWRASAPKADASEDFGILLVLAFVCIAGTVSWSHYYVWLIPAFAWLFARIPRDGKAGGRLALLGAAAALSWPAELHGQLLERGVFGPLTWILSSHLLIGGMIVFALLCADPWAGRAAVPLPLRAAFGKLKGQAARLARRERPPA